MKIIHDIEFKTGSKEEKLPGFMPDFPYIASYVELDKYIGRFVPWHWHKAVELFYMESGEIEYHTPKGDFLFPEGSGGMLNSNVLHMTRPRAEEKENIQLLHIFDPSLIGGEHGSRIEQTYVMPVTAASQLEMIALYPDNEAQADVLRMIRESFLLDKNKFGYEVRLREVLSEIWLHLFELARPILEQKEKQDKVTDTIKSMMIYVHEHYAEKLSVSELADSVFLSERECFRLFRDCLHMTPMEYVRSYRLQMACQMLANGQEPVTQIGQACGLGSSSFFGKTFREYVGCTPTQYRQRWQNNDRQ